MGPVGLANGVASTPHRPGSSLALSLAFMLVVVPRFVDAFSLLGLPDNRMLLALEAASRTVMYWGPVLPALMFAVVLTWLWSGRASMLPTGGRLLRRVPWMRGMLANAQAANFAKLFSLLVSHDVPLADGIELAARAGGNRDLIRDGEAIAGQIRQGKAIPEAFEAALSFPPLLKWLIVTGFRQRSLAGSLEHAAATYRRRALMQAELARTFLPTVFLILIGAMGTYIVTTLLFLPFASMLTDLSHV